jgi:anti-sigma28 factor (negative regulator of flagellin synthesis)
MEFQFTPKVTASKIDDPGRTKAVEKAKTATTAKDRSYSVSDALNLSPKAKLMQGLRTEYGKLTDVGGAKAEEIKQKLADQGTSAMSSEEIVSSILQGTLFQSL